MIECMKKSLETQDSSIPMVEKTGFEPATSWSRTKCTTKLCYFSLKEKALCKQDSIN